MTGHADGIQPRMTEVLQVSYSKNMYLALFKLLIQGLPSFRAMASQSVFSRKVVRFI
jgi:non-ribosomal peptide synthetase component E (peptide arylation enzyme)